MSFWSNPIGSIEGTLSSPKGLGEIALLGAAAYFSPEIMAYAGSLFPASTAAPIDLAASGVTGTAGAGAAAGASSGSAAGALENFGGAGPASIATGAPIDQASINAGLNSLGAGAGAAGAGAAGAAGAAGTASSLLSSPYAKAALGLGAGYLLAQKPQNNMPAAPGANPTGPLSILHGAGGAPGTRYAAGGGLMQINPNVPMSHNVVPNYATAQNTPVPQPVMNMRSGGNTNTDQLPDVNVQATSPYDQYNQYIQNLIGGQQMAGAYGLSPQQVATQQQQAQAQAQAQQPVSAADGGMMYASGGLSDLGSYSDGGRMLKGPGDGMSDSIPASIAGKQPARLANDEFVVPADVVSHLGNGSSDAGAKKLYEMMDRVRRARTGKPKQAKAINPERYMPG
jgi:hypothetical protein